MLVAAQPGQMSAPTEQTGGGGQGLGVREVGVDLWLQWITRKETEEDWGLGQTKSMTEKPGVKEWGVDTWLKWVSREDAGEEHSAWLNSLMGLAHSGHMGGWTNQSWGESQTGGGEDWSDVLQGVNMVHLVDVDEYVEDLPEEPSLYNPPKKVTISSFLPDGVVLTPMAQRAVEDPDLKVQIGMHPDATPAQREQLVSLIKEYKEKIIAYSMEDLREGYKGKVGGLQIQQLSDKMAFCRPKRHGPLKEKIADKFYGELEKVGIIEPAPHARSACNTTFAHKKAPDGSITDIRVCINYAPQNDLSAPQHTRFPVAEDLFQEIGDCRWLSKIDLKSGFLQIPVEPESREYTAFWWGTSLYRYTRMPFGMKQCPTAYQYVMDREFAAAGLSHCTKVFIDDVLIHSVTFEEHMEHLRAVFECLAAANLKIHPGKSCFGTDTMEFLGFDVSSYGLTPQEAKVEALMAMPHPRSVEELRVSMGKLRYYGCFCENFSAVARPLSDLLKKEVTWKWDPEIQGKAFDALRNEIATPGKALKRFDPGRPIFVHTDFSNRGLGAVLSQVDDEGNEYMVACISRSLNEHEARYPSYKGECLAAVWACRMFSSYLSGLFFTLVTDHEPLKWLTQAKELEGAMARWACMLQQYDFVIVHRPGVEHQNADALSRFPRESEDDRTGARLDPALPNGPSVRLVVPVDVYAWEHNHQPKVLKGFPDEWGVCEVDRLDTRICPIQVRNLTGLKEVTLMELCGGLCAGLEAVLRNGVKVTQYLYADTMEAARMVASRRVEQLMVMYPHLLSRQAVHRMFEDLPMDVAEIKTQHLLEAGAVDGGQWVVITGPPCQDFSPAGKGVGMKGARAGVFLECVRIIGALQQLQWNRPPLYIVENAAMQYNFRSEEVRVGTWAEVCGILGAPVTVDAALMGSYAHRLRNFWQNWADPQEVSYHLDRLERPEGIRVDSVLEPGRHSSEVYRSDEFPFVLANRRSQPRSCFPTLVAYPGSRAFRINRPGAVYDTNLGEWTEPTPLERERALGYEDGATAAPGVSQCQRHTITGNCMDQFCLSSLVRLLFRASLPEDMVDRMAYRSVYQHSVVTTVQVAPLPVVWLPPRSYIHDLSALLAVNPQFEAGVEEEEGYVMAVEEVGPVELPSERSPNAIFHSNKRLAKGANENGAVDVYEDEPSMQYLLNGLLPVSLTNVSTRRVIKRARGYEVRRVQGRQVVYRRMLNGSVRQVPPPAERVDIIESAHRLSGHFGVRRTTHLLLGSYWWQGIMRQVQDVVGRCRVCDEANASFTSNAAELHSLPISGLFFSWGVDTSGPFPSTDRGNVYIMHAVEHFSGLLVLEPLPNKEAKNTAYAFKHGVLERFGACAQVVTDQGTEYQGEFQALLAEAFIDHRTTAPNHPQANGLAERSVQTVKKALRKHCLDSMSTTDWDEKLSWIALAYNCSRQQATQCAPLTLLYAREPVFPSPTAQQAMAPPLGALDTPELQEAVAANLVSRAQYLTHVVPTIANNLAIASHRDTLRYAKTRGGSYLPKVRKFATGDFVYVRRRNVLNTLQTAAKQMVVRVLEVRPTGAVVLQGRCGCTVTNHVNNLAPCHLPYIDPTIHPEMAIPSVHQACEKCGFPDQEDVMLQCDVCSSAWHTYCLVPQLPAVPKGHWVCPNCTASGIRTVPEQLQRAPRGTKLRSQLADQLFGKKTEASKDRAHQIYNGRYVCRRTTSKVGQEVAVWGKVQYLGALSTPDCFRIQIGRAHV